MAKTHENTPRVLNSLRLRIFSQNKYGEPESYNGLHGLIGICGAKIVSHLLFSLPFRVVQLISSKIHQVRQNLNDYTSSDVCYHVNEK